MKVLLVEDDADIAAAIREQMGQWYVVDAVSSASEGERRARTAAYDLLVLDILLPDSDGITLCQRLRTDNIQTPILMLTGRVDVRDKVAAFDAGADDYLTKPFTSAELMARVRALLRRKPRELLPNPLTVSDLTLDSARRQVMHRRREIPLRRKEFDLLEYLMRHAGQIISRHTLLEHVWESEVDPLSNTVDVHVKYLRDKVDRPFKTRLIKTVHGLGYKIEPDPVRAHAERR